MHTILLIILVVGLFLLSFLTKRRFGVLGLALCAGMLLSTSWTNILTPIVANQGITLLSPPLQSVVAATLILLPPIILLFSGPSYSKMAGRIAGSVAFTLLAFVLLLQSSGPTLLLDATSSNIVANVTQLSNLIIAAGVCMALGDILMTRSPKGKG
jgi:hypothetical protein